MIRIAWICPNADERQRLVDHVEQSGAATTVAVASTYCTNANDAVSLRLKMARPDVVVIDMQNHHQALECLRFLGDLLADTSLFALATSDDPTLIIEAMRAGAREYIRPDREGELLSALGRFQAERKRPEPAGKRGHIYSVVGAKGGVGTTTVAMNLASAFSRESNARVALFDMAVPLGDMAARFDLKSEFGVDDALSSAPRLDTALLDSYTVSIGNIALLAGRNRFDADGVRSGESVRRLLEVSHELYDHIVLDLACDLDTRGVETALESSEKIVVICTAELPALWRAVRVMERLDRLGMKHKAFTIRNRWRRSDVITNAEIEKALKAKLDAWLPDDYATVVNGINKGQPLISSSRTELAKSYRQVAADLMGIEIREPRRSVLRLFG